MAAPNSYKQNTPMSMPSPQNNPHYMIAGPPMSFGMMKGGMNAPPHHNQYQYHPQYQGGPPMGHPQGYGGPWGQQSPQLARFAAEGARRAAAVGVISGGNQQNKDDKTSPFVNTLHSHPGFQPQKIGKGIAGAGLPKPPKPPEKPLIPYMRYSRRVWDTVKAQHPDLKLWEIGRIIGGMWRDLPEADKVGFVDEYEAEKAQYTELLKAYQASPAYIQWLNNKSRVGNMEDESSNKKGQKDQQQDRRIDIQPAEDEEDQDEGLSMKHIAYARYLRNHRLINEIFSDTVVPDVRSVVTTARMHILKKQVLSLTMHQTKLEDELQQIEEKFDAKKRKFIESSEAFQEELKKHCKPAVDEDIFQRMVDRAVEQIKRGVNPATQPLSIAPTLERKEVPMETDQNSVVKQEPTTNGPNPPTQVDKVSTSELSKPETHLTTELQKPEEMAPENKEPPMADVQSMQGPMMDGVKVKEEMSEIKPEGNLMPEIKQEGNLMQHPVVPQTMQPPHLSSPPHHPMMMPNPVMPGAPPGALPPHAGPPQPPGGYGGPYGGRYYGGAFPPGYGHPYYPPAAPPAEHYPPHHSAHIVPPGNAAAPMPHDIKEEPPQVKKESD